MDTKATDKASELNIGAFSERQTRMVKNLWRAATGTVILYLLIPHLLPYDIQAPDPTIFSRLRFILWAIALIELAVLLWWKRRVLVPERFVAAVHGNLSLALGHYAGKYASAFTMANSIAGYGLVLALLGRHFWDQAILTAVSLMLLFSLYPSGETAHLVANRIKERKS